MWFGIDPGKGGSIAALDRDGSLEFIKWDQHPADICGWLKRRHDDGSSFAILEYVRSSPQMGVVSAFTFGKYYGMALMGLIAAQIPFEEATPRKWQSALGCLTKGNKHVTRDLAKQLFPQVKVTLYNADAILLAEYARRLNLQFDGDPK